MADYACFAQGKKITTIIFQKRVVRWYFYALNLRVKKSFLTPKMAFVGIFLEFWRKIRQLFRQ